MKFEMVDALHQGAEFTKVGFIVRGQIVTGDQGVDQIDLAQGDEMLRFDGSRVSGSHSQEGPMPG